MSIYPNLFVGLDRKGQGGPQAGKTVLVTGGAGFLGSAICTRLIEQGARVICLDNLQTGRLENVTHLKCHDNFRFIEHDVGQPLQIEGPLDQIFNMACAASPPLYQMDPIHTMRTNVYGAMNMLELAERKNARILQASTSEVYGDPEFSPQPESYRGCVNTVGPRSCYDEGKRAAETLFRDFSVVRGVSVKIARIFNTYGPYMRADDGRVVSNFINQALEGSDLTIYGQGAQTRSFCYRDDLVEGLLLLMESPDEVSMPVNLGNPGEFTILELAQLVLEMTGSGSTLVHKSLPVDDPRQRRPDIERAQTLLYWAPTVDLRQGLQLTIDYFRRARQMMRPISLVSPRPQLQGDKIARAFGARQLAH